MLQNEMATGLTVIFNHESMPCAVYGRITEVNGQYARVISYGDYETWTVHHEHMERYVLSHSELAALIRKFLPPEERSQHFAKALRAVSMMNDGGAA
jgi:hypothetical protein